MWFPKSESESFLQPELNISGNVATKHPGDLWQPDNQLRQSDVGATEIEIPKLYEWEGAHNFAHPGYSC